MVFFHQQDMTIRFVFVLPHVSSLNAYAMRRVCSVGRKSCHNEGLSKD